ncbi:MAG: Hsp70 family protein, partial [Pseudomonadota bacterium]
DLGGGTFDVSILELGDGFFHVKAVSGNTRLGGDDWDQRLLDYFAEKYLNEHGVDIRSDKYALQRLKEASEKAKRALSCQTGVKISLPFIKPAGHCEARPPARWSEADRARAGRTQNGKLKDPEVSIDRKTFEAITSDLREKLVGPTRLALSDARLSPDEIDRIVLVGGSTRMPSVRELVEKIFNKKPYVKINPDEVVGIGAAVQAGVLTGEISDVVLVDVTPLSLGVETQGGLFTKIIHRNAAIPTSAGQIFTNAEDNQAVMDIHVLQGEREMAVDNFSLGQFQLTDIPTLPRGKAQVEVSFKIDVNGIVNVSAQELYTEKQTGIKINASYLMSDEQVKQAVSEAEAHAQEDMKKREALEINIQADSMIRAAELVVEEKKGKLSTSYLRQIESVILKVKEALAQGESSLIKNKTEALRKLLEKI